MYDEVRDPQTCNHQQTGYNGRPVTGANPHIYSEIRILKNELELKPVPTCNILNINFS